MIQIKKNLLTGIYYVVNDTRGYVDAYMSYDAARKHIREVEDEPGCYSVEELELLD